MQTIIDRIAVPMLRPYVSDCTYRSSASTSEVDMVAMEGQGLCIVAACLAVSLRSYRVAATLRNDQRCQNRSYVRSM